MTEFVLFRVLEFKLFDFKRSMIEVGYLNDMQVPEGREVFRVLEVLGNHGFSMVSFDCENLAGEVWFFMLQRVASAEARPLADVLREAAGS